MYFLFHKTENVVHRCSAFKIKSLFAYLKAIDTVKFDPHCSQILFYHSQGCFLLTGTGQCLVPTDNRRKQEISCQGSPLGWLERGHSLRRKCKVRIQSCADVRGKPHNQDPTTNPIRGTEGAATYAAWKILQARNYFQPEESVVLFITASGVKYL